MTREDEERVREIVREELRALALGAGLMTDRPAPAAGAPAPHPTAAAAPVHPATPPQPHISAAHAQTPLAHT